MSRTIQWTYVPPGASGSSTTRATALASPGTPSQVSGGETESPSQVYLTGIGWSASNAELLTVIDSPTSVAGSSAPSSPPQPAASRADARRAAAARVTPIAPAIARRARAADRASAGG